MTLLFIRIFFIILCLVVSYYIGDIFQAPVTGVQVGLISILFLILVERRMSRVSVRGLSSMVFGLVLGVIMAKLVADIMTLLPLGELIHSVSRVVLTLIFAYLGAVMALRGKDEFNIIIPYMRFKRQDVHDEVVILDTSAVIDGRISVIYKAHFISGRLVVPRFVLHELQTLADSSEETKRQKGRRGLELLRNMQNDPEVEIYIHDDSLEGHAGADAKLVTLARMMEAKICTTDYNLGQVASLRGITVLNIHELADSVRSAVFSGDELDIQLVKEGKETGQAVGYFADGTIVIVSNAKEKIGHTVKVRVTSVLQTQSGKMVFADMAG